MSHSAFGAQHPLPTVEPTPVPFSPPARDDNLTRVFSSLWPSGKYSDILIKCQGQTWKAHRAVVCVQSRPLAAAIDGNFKEAATCEIDLEDDDPEMVKLMLEFLYTGKISVDTPKLGISPDESWTGNSNPFHPSSGNQQTLFGVPSSAAGVNATFQAQQSLRNVSVFPFSKPGSNSAAINTSGQSSAPITAAISSLAKGLLTTSGVYVIAEKYDIQPLKTLALSTYDALLPSSWNSEFFIDSLRLIYDGTPDTKSPDDLRVLAIRTAAYHARDLMNRGEFLSLCRERGDIATDILKASLDGSDVRTGTGTRKRCRKNPTHTLQPAYEFSGFGTTSANRGLRYKCITCDIFYE